MTDISIE